MRTALLCFVFANAGVCFSAVYFTHREQDKLYGESCRELCETDKAKFETVTDHGVCMCPDGEVYVAYPQDMWGPQYLDAHDEPEVDYD